MKLKAKCFTLDEETILLLKKIKRGDRSNIVRNILKKELSKLVVDNANTTAEA